VDGTLWERARSWFGYKLHLIVDAEYELPVSYRGKVMRASASELREAKRMVEKLEERHKELVEGCEVGRVFVSS